MAELRIRVGASIDRSVDVAFRSLIDSAERARRATEDSARRSARTVAGETRRGTSAAEKEYAQLTRQVERWTRERTRAADRASASEIRSAVRAARERARAEISAQREVDREIAASNRNRERELARSARQAQSRQAADDRAFNRSVGAGVATSARVVGRAVGGIARSYASGFGIDLDLASHVRKNVDLEQRAVDLSNAAYMPGKAGPAGVRQDPKQLEAQARSVAIGTGQSSADIMEGLQKFQAKTGDLQTGRDVLESSAKLAKATGANLEDVLDAAGDVSNALGDVPDKGKRVEEVMRNIAAQGKEGAVEIKDLANQMAKLSGASSRFSGDRSTVMAQLGAITQQTRATGGAASATQAATSVMSFSNTFAKGARLDAFKTYGVDFAGKDGRVDVRKAIVNSIAAAGDSKRGGMKGFDERLGKMFMDVRANSVVGSYAALYKEAGGGEKGLKKVEEAFDSLVAATMREEELTRSFATAMETSHTKAQQFNEELGKVEAQIRENLLPVFKDLAPMIIGAVKDVANWIDELTGNKEKREQKQVTDAELRGINAASMLKQGQRTGVMANAETVEAAQAEKALADAIAIQQRRVVEDKKHFEIGSRGYIGDDEVEKAAKTGNEFAIKQRNDQRQLQDLKDTLENVQRERRAVDEKYMSGMLRVLESGTLKVEIVGGTPPSASGSKSTDLSGRGEQ